MNKVLIIIAVFAMLTLMTSCQKELPDNLKNIEVNQGGNNNSTTPQNPDTPTQQGNIPSEDDNPMPGY